MARRSENTSGVSVYLGRFYRNLGKSLNAEGEAVPKKFLPGTEQSAAEIANRRLEKLWNCVVAEHQDAAEFIAQKRGRLGDVNLISVIDHQKLRRVDHGPVWREESVEIAEAIRRAVMKSSLNTVTMQNGPTSMCIPPPKQWNEAFEHHRRSTSTMS